MAGTENAFTHPCRRTRDRAGKFIRSQATIQADIEAERMRTRLERDVKAAEHARGVVYEKGHYHALPNPDRLSPTSVSVDLPLLERAA